MEKGNTMQEEKKNKILDLNPMTQITMCLFFAISTALYDYIYTAAVLVILFVIAGMAGRLKEFVQMWLKTIVFITVVVFIMQALFFPGDTILWEFFIFSVKQEGIQNGIVLCTRLLGIGSSAVLAIKIVDVNQLVIALEERGVSPSATYVILSTVNIIPQMSKKMAIIMDAQKSRGIETESNVLVRAKAFFPTIGPLILNSIVNAEERTITLEARAFSTNVKKTRLRNVEDTAFDKKVRGFFILALLIAVIGRVIVWMLFM